MALCAVKILACVKISSSENNTKTGIAGCNAHCWKNLVSVTVGGCDFKHFCQYYSQKVDYNVFKTLSTL